MALKREVNCNKEPLIWGHLDTKAKEELEDDTRGNKKGCCDCKENWSFARVRLLHS